MQLKCTWNVLYISEIGLANDHSALLPPKDIFHTDDIAIRGYCYPDCFQQSYDEINLHSIIELGSKNVEKMKILKLTNGEMEKPCKNCKRDEFAASRPLMTHNL